jgi:hypothetical protein
VISGPTSFRDTLAVATQFWLNPPSRPHRGPSQQPGKQATEPERGSQEIWKRSAEIGSQEATHAIEDSSSQAVVQPAGGLVGLVELTVGCGGCMALRASSLGFRAP